MVILKYLLNAKMHFEVIKQMTFSSVPFRATLLAELHGYPQV